MIYLFCVFPLSRGQGLPAEVMYTQSWSGKMPCFISCQAVEALPSIKKNTLLEMTGCDKNVLLQAQLSREVQKLVKNKPCSANLGTFLTLAAISGKDISLVAACSRARAMFCSRGCGDFPTVVLCDPFSHTEVHLAVSTCQKDITVSAGWVSLQFPCSSACRYVVFWVICIGHRFLADKSRVSYCYLVWFYINLTGWLW